MIQEVRTYICDNEPEDKDIKEAISIVQREGFIMELKWFMQWSGWHRVKVTPDSTFESVKEQIPKIYYV